MKELIEMIAKTLVDDPTAVKVEAVGGGQSLILALKVARPDTGKVIGKQGRTAEAMRTILKAVSAKNGKRMVLEILE